MCIVGVNDQAQAAAAAARNAAEMQAQWNHRRMTGEQLREQPRREVPRQCAGCGAARVKLRCDYCGGHG